MQPATAKTPATGKSGTAVKPSPSSRRSILSAVGSQLNLCFTCGSCSAECPVNAATGKLDPRAMVRRAAFGQLGPMLDRREIWYCLQCNRCSNVCPMNVTPAELIRFVRRQAVVEGKLAVAQKEALDELAVKLQRVRHEAAAACQDAEAEPEKIAKSVEAFEPTTRPEPLVTEAPLPFLPGKTHLPEPEPEATADGEKPKTKKPVKKKAKKEPPPLRAEAATYGSLPTNLEACFTCYECRDACPVCLEPPIYDPLRHFRSALMDAGDALLSDPSIWLCIGCQSCTEACAQGVQGHTVMLRLQQLAQEKKAVDDGFQARWRAATMAAYRAWVAQVDALLDR